MFKSLTVMFVFLFSLISFALQVEKGKVILEKLEDYDLCQKHDYSGDWCHEAMKDWVEKHPADAFKAGKMTRKKMNAWVAMSFFEKAFEEKKGDCKDEDVKLSVVSALNLPKSENEKIISASKKIGFELCYDQMKEAILKEAAVGSYLFENTCADLTKKGELQGLKLKKCQELNK